jgi:hypothetical protein
MTTRLRPRYDGNARSDSVARTVTSVTTERAPLPSVGEWRVRRGNRGFACELNTGSVYGFVTGYGATEDEAVEAAWARYEEFRKREREA